VFLLANKSNRNRAPYEKGQKTPTSPDEGDESEQSEEAGNRTPTGRGKKRGPAKTKAQIVAGKQPFLDRPQQNLLTEASTSAGYDN
jgi:hypothetical protein